MKSLKLLIIGAGALVLTALPAAAVPSPVSDSLIVFRADGSISASNLPTEADELASPQNVWIVDHGIANAGAFGHPTFITEPDGTISDIFGVARDPGSGFITGVGFMSEDHLNLQLAAQVFGDPSGWINGGLEIPGHFYDATRYVDQGSHPGFTAQFQSDGNVPDGGSAVALLGIALAGIEVLRRKFRAA